MSLVLLARLSDAGLVEPIAVALRLRYLDGPFLISCQESPAGTGAYHTNGPWPGTMGCELDPVPVPQYTGDYNLEGMSTEKWHAGMFFPMSTR